MANEVKISEFTEKTTTGVDNDEIPIIDSEGPLTDSPKRIKLKNIISKLPTDVARLSLLTLQTFQGPIAALKLRATAVNIIQSAESAPTNIRDAKFVNNVVDATNNTVTMYYLKDGSTTAVKIQ